VSLKVEVRRKVGGCSVGGERGTAMAGCDNGEGTMYRRGEGEGDGMRAPRQ
jgi:hypothetical protein